LIHINGDSLSNRHIRDMRGARLRDRVIIDGAHGEGGGQILRTALSLSAITGRPLRIERIRALRRNPGLAAQHLTAVRAVAALCGAQLSGDTLGSTCLDFAPQAPVASGKYIFDVSLAREGGSAGAIMLVLQTVLLPLAFAGGDSEVELHGGTHMAWSPPFDYVRDVWLPALARLGVEASVELANFGWYPVGKGKVRAQIRGRRAMLKPLELEQRGPLVRIFGRAVAANLPAHIPQRMADRALSLLAVLGADLFIEPLRVRAACPGAGLFLTAEYANLNCGFSAIGAVGKPSEQVAEEAAGALLDHHASGAALDRHLGDQILLPLCFSSGPSRFSVAEITRHLETNAWVIERFGVARVVSERGASGTGLITLTPTR
jgi:RNA 3'-terminal phosphate cyclase (ATP)